MSDDEIRILYVIGGAGIGGMETHLITLASSLPPSVRCFVCCLEASADYRGSLEGGRNRARATSTGRFSSVPAAFWRMRGSSAWCDAFDRTSCTRTASSAMSSLACCAPGARASGIITSRRGEDANRRHQAVRRLVNRVADRIVCVSAETATFVRSTESPTPAKLEVIPNGVAVNPARDRVRTGQRDEPIRFGTLGTVKPIKGTDLLVDAFMRFDPQPRVELRIAGAIDRPWAEALRQRAQADPRIQFVGRSSHARGFLADLDVFVLPSRSEGMSNALLEAMSSELPCIATDVGSNRSLLNPAAEPPAGLICEPTPESLFHAMSELASSADLCRSYGTRGAALVERKYTIPGMVQQYERLYRSVVGRSLTHSEVAHTPCATE